MTLRKVKPWTSGDPNLAHPCPAPHRVRFHGSSSCCAKLSRMLEIRSVLRRPMLAASLLVCAGLAACAHRVPAPKSQALSPSMASKPPLIPWPVTVTLSESERFQLGKDLVIEVTPGQPDLERIGQDLASLLKPALDVE